jgi:hypothetical protein
MFPKSFCLEENCGAVLSLSGNRVKGTLNLFYPVSVRVPFVFLHFGSVAVDYIVAGA